MKKWENSKEFWPFWACLCHIQFFLGIYSIKHISMNYFTLLESPQNRFSVKHIFNYARLLYHCVPLTHPLSPKIGSFCLHTLTWLKLLRPKIPWTRHGNWNTNHLTFMHLNLKRTETCFYRVTSHRMKIGLYACARFGYEHASNNIDHRENKFCSNNLLRAGLIFTGKWKEVCSLLI